MLMKISVLGGGNEVGASCLYIELAETTILIDAGMRVHGENPLPALGMLDGLADPDVILVTHAHADHIGALPIVHSLYPDVPVYATPPSIDLMQIMMKDSYKILERRCRETNTLTPYSEEQVTNLLQSVLPFPASGELKIGNVTIKSFRAGHILGAVMFLIEGDGESLFVTGDLSFQAGRTIPGAQVPHGVQPDVLIMESTYGNRMHTDRNTEEKRLAEDVAAVIANGGFSLVPAFALGRAQEVLLVLQDYMNKGLIPEFPIYVDGLVTPISRVYKNYPHYLKGPVSHRIRYHGDAFLTEGRCVAVHPRDRESILSGKPGCIVASSGMLIGGASSWYAERLVSNEKNAIFITGYQDEESPGRKLLQIADGLEDTIDLNGKTMPIKCRIDKYGLSAHADASEMNRFVETLKPTYTLLVHGDDDARNQLGGMIDPRYAPTLVENGETYPFEKRKSGKGIAGRRYRNPVDDGLREKIGSLLLYQKERSDDYRLAICLNVQSKTNTLICQTLKGKQVRLSIDQIKETITYWNESIERLKEAAEDVLTFSYPHLTSIPWNETPSGNVSLEDLFDQLDVQTVEGKIAMALAMQSLPAEHIKRGPFGNAIYDLDDDMKNRLEKVDLQVQGRKMNPAQAMDVLRNNLSNHPRFIRCGADKIGTDQESLTIYFDFPDAVSEDERTQIAQTIEEKTGWIVQFSPSVRQDLLQSEIMKMFGSMIETPSIHLQERKVVIAIDAVDQFDKKARAFKQRTGFDLEMKGQAKSSPHQDKQHVFQAKTRSSRMENNEAMAEAKKWANNRDITVYKTSIKHHDGEPMLEVHFITPEIAIRHEVDLEELSYRIGMPVTYAKSPKQNELIQFMNRLLPEHWNVKKNPSIFMDQTTIAVKVVEMPSDDEIKSIHETLQKATGYQLSVSL